MKNGNWRVNRSPSLTYEGRKRYYRKQRNKVIKALGSKCRKCGYKDHRALQVDHKYGGGVKQQKSGVSGISMTNYQLKHLKEFQLLCANCNWIKRYNRNEQPKGNRKPESNLKG